MSQPACPVCPVRSPNLPRLRKALVLTALIWGLAQPSAGQTAEQAPGQTSVRETFTESIDVRVVNVEVVVTDRSGERVTGLGPEDFTLEVGREPRAIEYFSEVRDGLAVQRAGQSAPGLTAGVPVPTRYLLFVDGDFGMPAAYQQFHRALGEQIDRLEAHEEMAIVFYDGRELLEMAEWTSDRRDLRRALDEIDPGSLQGDRQLQSYRSYRRSIANEQSYAAESRRFAPGVTPLADLPEYAVMKKQLERKVRNISRATRAALYRYGDAPGRKVAILWSGGWPWNSREYLRPPWSRDLTSGAKTENELRSIADAANRLGYSLYMADTPVNFYGGIANDLHHQTLDVLARDTGGIAFKNRSGLGALDRSREDARTYYWLGFAAPDGGSGDRLKIKLETRDGRLKVRARGHYLDLPESEQAAQRIEATSVFGFNDAPRLRLDLGEPARTGLRRRVPISVGIPLDGLSMLPGPEGHRADVEVYFTVINDDGRIKDVPPIPLHISGPEPRPGDVFYYETELTMRKRTTELTVTVRDVTTDALLVGRRDLTDLLR
ncbi:MAG: VWA domain-containing protein [Acidobacteriota bacterium]